MGRCWLLANIRKTSEKHRASFPNTEKRQHATFIEIPSRGLNYKFLEFRRIECGHPLLNIGRSSKIHKNNRVRNGASFLRIQVFGKHEIANTWDAQTCATCEIGT